MAKSLARASKMGGVTEWFVEHRGKMAATVVASLVAGGLGYFLFNKDSGDDGLTYIYLNQGPVGTAGEIPAAGEADAVEAPAWHELYQGATSLEVGMFEHYLFTTDGAAVMSYSVESDQPVQALFVRTEDVERFAAGDSVDAWGELQDVTSAAQSAELQVELDAGDYAFIILCQQDTCNAQYSIEYWL